MAKRRNPSGMPLYRPVSTRLWNDQRFLAMNEDGKRLWLFLLTCPALPIPGVIIAGEGSIAEVMGWTVEGVREGFREAFRVGMNIRVEGRVVWLVNATKHQPCAGPNAIRCWARFWGEIPDGPLKRDILQSLRIAAKSWSHAFNKSFGTPSGTPSGKGSTQEHQHEHKQENQHEQERESADDPAEVIADLIERLPAPPAELAMGPDWQPRETNDNRAAAAEAKSRGVFVEHARRKFVQYAIAEKLTLVDVEPRWRLWLLRETPTPAAIVDAIQRVDREQRERSELEERRRAQREREREREQRAAADLPAVQRRAARNAQGDYTTEPEELTG